MFYFGVLGLLNESIERNAFHLTQADQEGARLVVLLAFAKLKLTVVQTETQVEQRKKSRT
jgi:hypothetical protein